jgi:hypothetical protein
MDTDELIQLITRARAGDHSAYDQVVRRFQDMAALWSWRPAASSTKALTPISWNDMGNTHECIPSRPDGISNLKVASRWKVGVWNRMPASSSPTWILVPIRSGTLRRCR